jgi:hypothetical protein
MARTAAARPALEQARALWRDAISQPLPADQFRIAHLAALRATAALLATRAEAGPRAAHRPTSAWVLVLKVVPEFAEWASYFAAGVPKRAAADAGAIGAVSADDAAELIEAVRVYLALVHTELVCSPRRAGERAGAVVLPLDGVPVLPSPPRSAADRALPSRVG